MASSLLGASLGLLLGVDLLARVTAVPQVADDLGALEAQQDYGHEAADQADDILDGAELPVAQGQAERDALDGRTEEEDPDSQQDAVLEDLPDAVQRLVPEDDGQHDADGRHDVGHQAERGAARGPGLRGFRGLELSSHGGTLP